jgi:hypothetical protein
MEEPLYSQPFMTRYRQPGRTERPFTLIIEMVARMGIFRLTARTEHDESRAHGFVEHDSGQIRRKMLQESSNPALANG